MTNEQILSDYMARYYTDEALAALLAHAEDGRLSYYSCTCFIGVPPAVAVGAVLHGAHCGLSHNGSDHSNYANIVRRTIPEADRAEDAFAALGQYDDERRAKLIPLIRSEMSRREGIRNLKAELSDLGETLKEASV